MDRKVNHRSVNRSVNKSQVNRRKKKKRQSNPRILLRGIRDALLFFIITTPLVFFFGPYKDTRKAVLETVLATRHAYLVEDLIPKTLLDKLLGRDEANNSQEVFQDMKKINVKYKIGNEITEYHISDKRYEAYVLEIKNPLKVKVAMTRYLKKRGQKTSEMAEDHNAVAAINGGSFIDQSSDGTTYAGTGAEPGGFVISDGKVVYPTANINEKAVENVVAFTEGGELIVGDHSISELKKYKVKEAMCFRKPNIIINGVRQVKDKATEGYNPRTAVGQKADGTIIFLVIDGRKITTPGASLYDVQEIMMKQGAVNAGALDGGYSSTMYYKGNVINSPNAWDGERTVATAFYVEQ
ncbi:phosphodiester glycosidase family protein [Clostridium sp. YIM B02555]|uniref:phosphodiester glycosidase family protein n=1 Tax=Clostridium sp. YIM B02555 TaxID=2911968 RepID=UPI001EEE0666|nr:phosphodiester glycosidase family protein [Clostridium sp. YIM B02555]